MANKIPYTIANQIALLKERGMTFRNETEAFHFLQNISYYRLKGYWWEMQEDNVLHKFKPNTYFEDIANRYDFDRRLRLILFDAIEHIEIVLRTKIIYHLSITYGATWYKNISLFDNTITNNTATTLHQNIITELQKEFNRSQEIFIKDQRTRFPNQDPDAWKILEVASMGTLSKLYKSLKHQLPEKAIIAKEMGLNLHTELSSCFAQSPNQN